MAYNGKKNGDDTEILGRINKITRSPAGGKRLEVEAKFQNKIEVDQPHLPFYMKKPSMADNSNLLKTIKIDMSYDEARNFKEEDEIRARIREKYAKEGRSGACGMGARGDIYNYVGPSKDKNSSSSRGMGSSKWDRFKGA